jgi:steroid delta-isomerase-like uncharacterized protein
MNDARDEIMNLMDRVLTMWNSHNYGMASELYAEDYRGVDVTNHSRLSGPDGVARELERVRKAFPDLAFRNEHTLCENDRVALYWSARGTHQGTVLNIPATGRTVEVNGVTLLRVANGKIAQGVHLWDMAGLLRDLGLLPELDYRAPSEPSALQDALMLFA